MATENLEINIGANTQDLQNGLNQASQSVTNFGRAVQTATKPTADATQSLVNLSRIAQDAPYGFIGISNNLNPMLESFQRLQKETGSAGEALKAMLAGLTGPAGLGLALGVVSSLIVAFGDNIVNYINGTDSAKKAQDEFNKSLEDSKTKAAEQATSLNLLIAVAENANASDEQRAKALNAVKEAIGKVNKDYAEHITSVDSAREAVNLYTQALIQQAIAQRYQDKIADKTIELTNLTKEVSKATIEYAQAQKTAATMTNGYVDASVVQASVIGKAKGQLDDVTKSYNNTKNAIKELNEDLKATTDAAVKMPFFTELLLGKSGTVKPKEAKTTELKDQQDYYKEREKLLEEDIKATMKWANEQLKISETVQKSLKKYNDVFEFEINKGDKTPKKLDKDLPDWAKEWQEKKNRFDSGVKQSQEIAKKFAETISQDVTQGFLVMFDAVQQGKNPLLALGDYLGQLVKQFAAAIVQATIFKGLMSIFSSFVGGGGGFFGGILGSVGKLLGMAEGGIVSRPTIAMVGEGGQSEAIMPLNKLGNMMNSTFNAGAMSGTGVSNGQFVLKGNDLVLALQRSNYSLNLRRGNGI